MTVRPEQTWQRSLEQLVSTVLAEGHAEPGLVEASFELARSCDPATERDVVFVCDKMLKLAAYLRDLNEHSRAADALSLAVELAVNSYVQMSSPDLILGLARYLRHEGQSDDGTDEQRTEKDGVSTDPRIVTLDSALLLGEFLSSGVEGRRNEIDVWVAHRHAVRKGS
jgi:hypothetical protein